MTAHPELAGLVVDAAGIIRTPGRFEGEPYITALFWAMALDGFADVTDGRIYVFKLNEADVADLPELAGVTKVFVWQCDDGRVRSYLARGGRS